MRVPAAVLPAVACAALAGGCTRTGASEAPRLPPAVPVEAAPATFADVADVVDVVGALAPKLAAELKSEYSGIVAAVHVTDWVPVRKGQPLAALDTRESEAILGAARAGVQQAEVADTRALREMERGEKLKAAGLMTAQALEDLRTARAAARAALEAARAQATAAETRLAKMVIRAPFDGVVAARGVNVGDRVENMGSGAAMFEIVDDRVLELTMTVPSSKLGRLGVGQPVEFTVDAVPDETFTGHITHISPSVDPVNRAAKVVADVGNAGRRLKGGLFVQGRIQVGAHRGLQIPRAALQGWDVAAATADVFVIEGETAQRRTVRLGAVSADAAEVVQGLSAGERVAARGAFALKAGDRVRALALPGA